MATSLEPSELRTYRLQFYKNPLTELIANLLEDDLKNGLDLNAPESAASIYFYVRLIQQYPDAGAEFTTISQAGGKCGELARRIQTLSTTSNIPNVDVIDIDASVLDMLWSEYSVTGSISAVRRVISVLDWDDRVRAKLDAWLQQGPPKLFGRKHYESTCRLLHECCFPIDFQQRAIDESVDLDLHVALAVQNGHLSAKQLPISLSADEWVKLGTKSAAIWSLKSFALEDPIVAAICAEEAEQPGGAGRLILIGRDHSEP